MPKALIKYDPASVALCAAMHCVQVLWYSASTQSLVTRRRCCITGPCTCTRIHAATVCQQLPIAIQPLPAAQTAVPACRHGRATAAAGKAASCPARLSALAGLRCEPAILPLPPVSQNITGHPLVDAVPCLHVHRIQNHLHNPTRLSTLSSPPPAVLLGSTPSWTGSSACWRNCYGASL